MDAARYRKIARVAFPDGFLAVRGVLTVGGWTRCSSVGSPRIWWANADTNAFFVEAPRSQNIDAYEVRMRLLAEGDLLPDYADPLTKLAILSELSELRGGMRYPPAWIGDILPIDLVPRCATEDGEIEAVFVALARLRAKKIAPPPPIDYSPDIEISDHGLNG